MRRRDFLGAIAAPVLAADARPNILFAIADDWSWPFASIAGDKSVNTPTFDRIAREGVLFPHAYCVAPSCSASRASILTGQWFARLQEGADLWGTLPAKFPVYPDLLERSGYLIGFTGKGWGPGSVEAGGRTRNPAGPAYNERKVTPATTGMTSIDYAANFAEFLRKRTPGQPFCFWYGGQEPHRPYEAGSGLKAGKRLEDVRLPGALPDAAEVRGDLLDYAWEIDYFDTQLGKMIKLLEAAGELDNTLIVVTGDNGLPFPRCKTNLYDSGTNVPLAIRWGRQVPKGRVVQDFVSLADLAPTFLEAAGLTPGTEVTARSLLPVLRSDKSGTVDPQRDRVFTGRERHTQAQPNGAGGYPMRSIRTAEYFYIRNFKPELHPAGYDSEKPSAYRDIDAGPAKSYMMAHRDNLFELGFGKRPAEELYLVSDDPAQLNNVARLAKHEAIRKKLADQLEKQLKQWGDPRATGGADAFDSYKYFGKE